MGRGCFRFVISRNSDPADGYSWCGISHEKGGIYPEATAKASPGLMAPSWQGSDKGETLGGSVDAVVQEIKRVGNPDILDTNKITNLRNTEGISDISDEEIN